MGGGVAGAQAGGWGSYLAHHKVSTFKGQSHSQTYTQNRFLGSIYAHHYFKGFSNVYDISRARFKIRLRNFIFIFKPKQLF